MAYLLRMAKQNRWLVEDDEDQDWIDRGTAPADIAADFCADENRLSLWRVNETDAHTGNLKRVILALAGNRSNLGHFEYILFDEDVLEKSGVKIENTDGDVLDPDVAPYHVDVNVANIDGLAHFLKYVWFSATRIPRRVLIDDLAQWSFDALNAGTFKEEYCKSGVLRDLRKRWEKLGSDSAD